MPLQGLQHIVHLIAAANPCSSQWTVATLRVTDTSMLPDAFTASAAGRRVLRAEEEGRPHGRTVRQDLARYLRGIGNEIVHASAD